MGLRESHDKYLERREKKRSEEESDGVMEATRLTYGCQELNKILELIEKKMK